MSQPDSAHPWSRHYAEKGGARPGVTHVPGLEFQDGLEPVAEDARLIGALPVAPAADASAAVVNPAAAAAKIDWNAAPDIELFTAADLARVQRETEARRWSDTLRTLRLLGYGVGALVLLVLGFELLQRLGNRLPSEAALAAQGNALATRLLREHSTAAQPLIFAQSEPVLHTQPAAARANYEFTITLRLREPLYAPADSNGAQAYLNLQRAVADAHARIVGARLYAQFPELAIPVTLPPLLAVTHRAGERVVVRVPVAATRRLWGWRLEPDFAAAQVTSPRFTGEVLARHPASHLIFNRAESRETIRTLQADARAYVLAVQRALATRRSVPTGR